MLITMVYIIFDASVILKLFEFRQLLFFSLNT